ncbi:type IV toxin-antitoxin system AbiEi family antitoxin [Capnocytophaga leadbetteri]|uniref:type IV toxin-antitoxin system AbiEi family antitoxin domain-containing protein n=1 Tax=Capnocytophaga leadbetteri TaxID=327575 RepID=UPI0026F24EDE|nr:type IV toxin-antitoxin system AbiEi family antitoxin [Capnocytophaga leadbetteri]
MKGLTIRKWIQLLEEKGIYSFSMQELKEVFAHLKEKTILNTLGTLKKQGKLLPLWNGIYSIVRFVDIGNAIDNKAIREEGKPYFYIETLMQHLKREYYVALLSAVEVYLSPKEALQANEITVITSLPPLRDSFRGQGKIRYFVKKDIKNLREIGVKRKTLPFSIKERTLRVASLELTAVDLLLYEKEIGGIQKAVEVIQRIKNHLSWQELPTEVILSTPVSIFQRLGYVLSFIKEEELAERLKERVLSTGKKFRRTLLKTDVPEKGGEPFCPIWKIVVNISLQNDTL